MTWGVGYKTIDFCRPSPKISGFEGVEAVAPPETWLLHAFALSHNDKRCLAKLPDTSCRNSIKHRSVGVALIG